jgi:hypothetical protein
MLLTDNPIQGPERDRFGFAGHAQVLCSAIEATDDLPLTVAVYGAWGTGKSSFINVCRVMLEARGMPVISFNPWKYDQREEVWHALIQTVLNEISRQVEGDARAARRARLEEIQRKVIALSRTAAWLVARRAVVPLTAGVLTADDIDAAKDAMMARAAIEYRHVNHFEEDFAEVVADFTSGGKLVVLIDDLDRCSPEAAVTVLDSLKLFLGQASCIFVLAMDQEMIVDAVSSKFGGDKSLGRRYLEKLVQLPFYLPYVTYESIYSQLADCVVGLGEDPALWELIRTAYKQNPRQVRRFINMLNIAIRTLQSHSAPSRARMLHAAILLTMRLQYPGFFTLVARDAGAWSRFEAAGQDANMLAAPQEKRLAEENPSLCEFFRAISPMRDNFDFPDPPSGGEIEILTQVVSITTDGVSGPASAADQRGGQ